MSNFTDAELEFLHSGDRRLARVATIGPDGTPHVTPVGYAYDPETDGLAVRGLNLVATKKYRDLRRNPRVAIVVDEVLPPWRPRGIEARGHADVVDAGGSGPAIRIHPERIVSWGLESDELGHRHARSVAQRDQVTGLDAGPAQDDSEPGSQPMPTPAPGPAETDALARYQISEILQAVEIAIDQRDAEGFASHFTLDAYYQSPFSEHTGRESIAEMSRAHHASGSMVGKRRMTGPATIELSPDRSRALAYSHWWVAEAATTPGVYSTGTYTDQLRKDDSTWRIERRVQVIDPSWKGTPPPAQS
jgi:pyridoxamine 5'-phosphate oxidase family protein